MPLKIGTSRWIWWQTVMYRSPKWYTPYFINCRLNDKHTYINFYTFAKHLRILLALCQTSRLWNTAVKLSAVTNHNKPEINTLKQFHNTSIHLPWKEFFLMTFSSNTLPPKKNRNSNPFCGKSMGIKCSYTMSNMSFNNIQSLLHSQQLCTNMNVMNLT